MNTRETGPIPRRVDTSRSAKESNVLIWDPSRRRTPPPTAGWPQASPRVAHIIPRTPDRHRRASGETRLVPERYRGLFHVAPNILRNPQLAWAIISVREQLFTLGMEKVEFAYPNDRTLPILLDDELDQLLRRLDGAESRNTAPNIEFTVDPACDPTSEQKIHHIDVQNFGRNIDADLCQNSGLIRRMMRIRKELKHLEAASVTAGLRWNDQEAIVQALSGMIVSADVTCREHVAPHIRFQTGWQPADEEYTPRYEINLGDMLGIIQRSRDIVADRISFYEEENGDTYAPIEFSTVHIRCGDGKKVVPVELREQYGYAGRLIPLRDFLREQFGLMVR